MLQWGLVNSPRIIKLTVRNIVKQLSNFFDIFVLMSLTLINLFPINFTIYIFLSGFGFGYFCFYNLVKAVHMVRAVEEIERREEILDGIRTFRYLLETEMLPRRRGRRVIELADETDQVNWARDGF